MTEFPEPSIIYQDENIVAANKPAGLLVHGLSGKDMGPTLAEWVVRKYPETKEVGDDPQNRPGVVHRLDKETSGIIILARNQKYFSYLKSLFQNHKMEKKYLAWVYGVPKDKKIRINIPIGIRSGSVHRSVHSGKMSKEAVTDYSVKECKEYNGRKICLVEVFPKTGRTHQIRVHLASIGHPVVGDAIYGGKMGRDDSGGMRLHAYSLEFEIQPGRKILLEAEPPKSFDP
ncbi:MAG: RNA pseudouridine synthase [Candidatus Liptonbacteria bacterium]